MTRQSDILALQVDSTKISRAPQKVPLSFGDETRAVAGVQKLIQSFLTLFLTKSGASWNPELGCSFLGAVEQGLIRTEIDARNYFASVVPSLIFQVNRGAVFADEIAVSAILLDVVVERSKLSLRIQLTTAAGSSTTFLAPL
jgi:hypothetical protein